MRRRRRTAALTLADEHDVTAVQGRRVEALYREMLARPAHERAAALAAACPDDLMFAFSFRLDIFDGPALLG